MSSPAGGPPEIRRIPVAPGVVAPRPAPGPRCDRGHRSCWCTGWRPTPGCGTAWPPRLAGRGHPVAAVDQRGHGQSDKPDGGYDFATLTEDLAAILADLGWEGDRPPLAAGQSWGANVVLELGGPPPRSQVGLVLVDGGTIELADRFADWPTCEAALAPPPLTGTTAVRLRAPDPAPPSGLAGGGHRRARSPTSRCCPTAPSGRGCPGSTT